MRVNINNLTRRSFVKTGFVSLFKQIFIAENIENNFEVTVTIVGPKRMRELNYRYRKDDVLTDVLSFNEPDVLWPLNDKSNGLGELVICPTVIEENAKQYGVKYFEELKRVVIHGALHLLKYDHKKNMNDSREEIYIRQEKYLKSANRLSLIK